MYNKLGQACVTNQGTLVLLQIRANVVTIQGSFIITNWGKCCYKLGQLLQIRATVFTKQGSYYKQTELNVLQTGAGITNLGNYYKLGHSKCSQKRSHIVSIELNIYLIPTKVQSYLDKHRPIGHKILQKQNNENFLYTCLMNGYISPTTNFLTPPIQKKFLINPSFKIHSPT